MSKFVMAKMKGAGYRKLLSNTELFPVPDLSDSEEYKVDGKLDENQFFVLKEFSQKHYFPSDMLVEQTTLNSFEGNISDISFLISVSGNLYLFQNVTKSQMLTKKFISFGDNIKLKENEKQIIIKGAPDAIYDSVSDNLYFTDLVAIKTMFPGIDELYRVATDDETQSFLASPFINLLNGFDFKKVKVANRQRIALANDELKKFEGRTDELFKYINEYVPALNFNDGKFDIHNEADLKNLLYGIEQRFFTTPLGKEKLIAKSIIPIASVQQSK